jgi:hypothetical protein
MLLPHDLTQNPRADKLEEMQALVIRRQKRLSL